MYMNEDDNNIQLVVTRFEVMLKSNKILFFDAEDFEDIIFYYLDLGRINLAKKAIKLAEEQHPNSVGIMLAKVEMLLLEKKFVMAQRLINEVRNIDPKNEEVYIQQASIYSKRGLHQQAIEALNLALQYTTDFAEVYSLLAMQYVDANDYENALIYFKKCVFENPDDETSMHNAVNCYDVINSPMDENEAKVFIMDYIAINPYSERAWMHLGRQFIKTQQYDDALQSFDYAQVINPLYAGPCIEKGKIFEIKKDYSQALLHYQEALLIDALDPFVLWRIGVCYEQLNKFKKAVKYYKKTIKEDPMLDKAYLSLTDLYIKRGKYEKALVTIQKTLQLDGENIKFLRRLGKINKALGHFFEAIDAYEKSLKLGDVAVESYVQLGDCFIKTRQHFNALTVFEQGNRKRKGFPELMYRVAGALFLLGMNDKAEDVLESTLKEHYKYFPIFTLYFPQFSKLERVQLLLALNKPAT